jgi:hypothetical protein
MNNIHGAVEMPIQETGGTNIIFGVDEIPLPMRVTARSRACAVFARSNPGIVRSNPTRGMQVCVRLFCLCCSVCTQQPCDGLIPRPRIPTDCV